ncbi:MAG TPA: ATP-binding protein [bacterium]|nr:ATP-binding protein [bacterium]
MTPITRSIRFKLIATYMALAALSLAVVTAVVVWGLQRSYVVIYKYVALSQARLISTMIAEYIREEPMPIAEIDQMAQRFKWRPDVTIAVLDPRGRRPGAALDQPVDPEVAAAISGSERSYHVRIDSSTGQGRIFAAAGVGKPQPAAIVQVSVPSHWVRRQLQDLLPWLGAALALGLAAAALVGGRMARSLTAPIETLTRAAERMREGDLDESVVIRSRDEIGRLGEAFSAMAGRLRETIRGLREERHTLEAILTGMVDAVVALDHEGRVMMINRAAEEFLGVRRETVIGFPAAEVLPAAFWAVVQEAIAQRRVVAAELPAAEGEALVEIRCAPIGGNGDDGGIVAVLRDVTELRRTERLRRELTANVSHELRTPLTSIKGFAETLLSGAIADPASSRHFLEIIDAEADRLVKLVDDLMDLSRWESRGASLELAPVDLPALIAETMAHLRPLAGARHLTVASGDGRAVVLGDRDRLAQVLTNLIDNAIKFTGERGNVEVGWAEADGSVVITVRDDGRGIPAQDVPHVFDRFYKAGRTRSGSGGSGLGLAISRHIVQAHGGQIGVRSSEGIGTTLTVTLPKAENGNGLGEVMRMRG